MEPSLVGISLETNRHPLAILGPLPLGEPSTPYFQYTLSFFEAGMMSIPDSKP